MSKPHISRREYIRWPPAVAYENTNTLVVTSPSGYFVDIRMRIPERQTAASHPPGIQPGSALEWAFGGISSTSIATEHSTGRQYFEGRWNHLIDSRFTNSEAELFQDSGEMISLEKGKSLERGMMVDPYHPEAGERAYEECWNEVEISSQKGDGRREFVVLKMEREEDVEVRGLVVRVGQVCQGIVRVGEEFSIERWVWAKVGGWQRDVKVGSLFVPMDFALHLEKVELGDEIGHEGLIWKVVELGITE